jgi:hypothetical protein
MEDFDRPLSLYDNLSEVAAQQKQLQPHLKRKPLPTPNPAMSIADNFEFNNIKFQFDDLQPSPTSPLLISAPPPKPRRAVITPPRFSLDQRLNSLRPIVYPPSNNDINDTKYNGNNHKPDNNVTQSFDVNENNEKKQSNQPQTTNYDNRLHNDITNAISNLKPVHSEAKSSFFGLNGTHNKNNNDLSPDLSRSNNDDDNKPLDDQKSAVKIQQQQQPPPPVVMRRLRDTLKAPVVVAKKPSPRFSRDSLESRESEFNDSNRNSKANSSTSSSSTDRTVTPNTTLLSLLAADTPKKAVTNNNNKSNDQLNADSPSPRNTRFLLPEEGMEPRKESDGVDGRNSSFEKRLSQLDPNQQVSEQFF